MDPLHILAHVAPPPAETLCEWAERCLVLGTRQPTPFPGALRLSRTPYLRGILDALDDPAIRTVVVEAGAQTGKTTAAYAWLLHAICCDPAPALVVYPSEDLARSNSATRIQPLVEDSPALAHLVPADRRQYWQLLQYRVNGCSVHLTGANSPAQLASRPIRYLLLDEVDKYPAEATRGEADAVSLAIQRTRTFWNAKILMVSTPTTPAGAIHRAYMRGDRREYEVPCPGCGARVRLQWRETVRWPERDPSAARIRCPRCGRDWTEAERRAAIAAGAWTPTAPASDPATASFHLSALCALWCDLPALARKFERAARDPVLLRDFANSDLAEPYVEADARLSSESLAARVAAYDDGEPLWPSAADTLVVGGCDVQLDYFVLVLRQFRADGSSAQLLRAMPRTLAEIEDLMRRHDCAALAIDARYRTSEILQFALRVPGVLPVKGVSGFRAPRLYEAQTADPYGGRRGGGLGLVTTYMASSDALMDMLDARVSARAGAPAWHIPRGALADPDYIAQMTAQYRSNGRWLNPSRAAEHYADAEKYALLAAAVCGIALDPDPAAADAAPSEPPPAAAAWEDAP